jgi:hypothetical protein
MVVGGNEPGLLCDHRGGSRLSMRPQLALRLAGNWQAHVVVSIPTENETHDDP